MRIIASALFGVLGAAPPSPPPMAPPLLLEEVVRAPAGDLHVGMQTFAIPAAPPERRISDLPGHRHTGHIYVYVLEGQVRSKLDDAPDRLYSAGQTWLEEPGQLHRILNPVPGTIARLLVVSLDTPH